MAWNSDPKVRGLGDYCKKHKYEKGIFIGVYPGNKTYTVTTYGSTATLCKRAKTIGDVIFESVQSGDIVLT